MSSGELKMHRTESGKSTKGKLLKGLALLVMMESVLLVSTACLTTRAARAGDEGYKGIMANLVPERPTLPRFPSLSWEIEENGRFSITREDADRLLDYRDNLLPLYEWEMEKWTDKQRAVLECI